MTFSMMILILLCIDLQELFFFLVSNPFLLIGTLKLHFVKSLFKDLYESFTTEKLLRDLYVDDLVSSVNNKNLV